MLVPYSWLKDYLDLTVSPQELAEILTDAGIEVENIISPNTNLEGIVTAKIKSVDNHPAAEKLYICVVDTGNTVKTVVTAAANLYKGAIVPFALPGAKLINGKIINNAVFKGVVSEGMLCSAQELGIKNELLSPDEREGIFILPEDVPLGKNVTEILALNDYVLELSLTPNRSDCLSMINVAREIAANIRKSCSIKDVDYKGSLESSLNFIDIQVSESELCKRYIGKIVTDVKVGQSPLWMQNRLRAAGIRPINNIVDVTNYVLLEYGQPMHAFDYDLIKGKKINVRRAEANEKIVTLDGIERTLDEEILVISDAERAVAIAGIMGGADTEVTYATKNILLEAAVFEGSSIRKNSKKLGLRSESSHRFEKGIDIENVGKAMDRAAQLIEQIGAGVPAKDSIDIYPDKQEPVSVYLSVEEVNDLLGTELEKHVIEDTFLRLGFPFENTKDKYLVKIPSYRRDITRSVDLIEEVARLYGYNNIPTTLPKGQSVQVTKSKQQVIEEIILHTLLGCGLNEIITYSFINPQWFDKLLIPEEDIRRSAIVIQNPLNEDQRVMRTSLLPGLLENVRRNFSYRNTTLSIFEMGRVFFAPLNPLPEEKNNLAIFLAGAKQNEWKTKHSNYDFYDLKGILEEIFNKLRIDALFTVANDISFLHPGRAARVIVNGKECGYIGEIHPIVAEKYDFPERGYVCELNLDVIFEASNLVKVYRPLPKYPAVTRDIALLVPENVTAFEVEKTIYTNGGNLLQEVKLFDIYVGEQIAAGHKSMAYSLVFQSGERTLTDEEINHALEGILSALKKLGITLR